MGRPHARPEMVWVTTDWKMEAAMSSPCGAFVQQRLHVGLGKHAAAAGDGIDGGGVSAASFVQAAGIGVQQGGHLVDEGALPPAQVPFMRCSMPLSK